MVNAEVPSKGLNGGGQGEAAPPSALQLTESQFRAFLLTLSNQTGCVAELARRLDISGQYLGDLIAGKKRPGPKILKRIGAQVERIYTVTVEASE